MVGPDALLVALDSTRCEPERRSPSSRLASAPPAPAQPWPCRTTVEHTWSNRRRSRPGEASTIARSFRAAGDVTLSSRSERAHGQTMTTYTDSPRPVERPSRVPDPLRLAVAAYLARFKGSSRDHTDSDLRCYLTWCAERGLDPLAARRPHLELYIRWMQEIRLFKPSTVSRRFSVTAGFYRTCVIDGVWSTHPPSMSAARRYRRNHPRSGSLTCSSRPC